MLSELQREFSRALLADKIPALDFAPGVLPIAAALKAHRNTVLGALCGALRLSCPTLDKLVGETFFDAAAAVFAQAHPPTGAHLSQYGDGFADFLRNFPPAAALPWLGDVARLDLALERAARAAPLHRRFELDAHVSLDLPASLTVLQLDYPAGPIRDAVEAGDDAALRRLTLAPQKYCCAVWRRGPEAMLREIGLPAALFLESLLAGGGAAAALAAAMTAAPETALATIQTDVFAASFCRVMSGPQPS